MDFVSILDRVFEKYRQWPDYKINNKKNKKETMLLHIDQIKITQYTVQMKHSHFESFSNKTTPKASLIRG